MFTLLQLNHIYELVHVSLKHSYSYSSWAVGEAGRDCIKTSNLTPERYSCLSAERPHVCYIQNQRIVTAWGKRLLYTTQTGLLSDTEGIVLIAKGHVVLLTCFFSCMVEII